MMDSFKDGASTYMHFIFQFGKQIPAVLRDLEFFKKSTPDLMACERGGAFVRLKTDLEIKRGAVSST